MNETLIQHTPKDTSTDLRTETPRPCEQPNEETGNAAEVWPVGKFIQDELNERGWTVRELAMRLVRPHEVTDAKKVAINQLALDLLIYAPQKGVRIGYDLAADLARVFDTSESFWVDLDKAWQDHTPNTQQFGIESRFPSWAKWKRVKARPHGERFPFDSERNLVFDTVEEANEAADSLQRSNAGDFRVVEIATCLSPDLAASTDSEFQTQNKP